MTALRRTRRRTPLAVLLTVLVVVTSFAPAAGAGGPATASSAAPGAPDARDRDARVAELKKRGDELLDGRRYAEALAAYDDAYALNPTAALLYNRGRALQFLGRYPEALGAIEQFAKEASPELRDRVPALARLLADLRGRVGTLVVSGVLDGARVLVNDRQVGVTPLAGPLSVPAGRVTLDVFAEGYFPLHRDVEVAPRTTRTLDLRLVSRDTAGLLVVRAHVPATRVSIDGTAFGLAPVEAGLLVGSHRVVAESDGYDAAATQVVMQAGDRRETWLDPIARPPVYARWWFWTAVGVVVAGGIVTYVALTTERSAPSGTYSPGTIRF